MLASGLVLGIVGGIAFGGDWRRLGQIPLRWVPVLLAALAIRVLGLVIPFALAVYLAALAGTAVAAILNRHLPGVTLIAAGSLLNIGVIALNGGMPVDPAAVATANAISYDADRLHVPFGPETRLPLLADVIPLALVRGVYSVGDVVIAIGGFWLPFAWLRGR
jgi:hypothetical protein